MALKDYTKDQVRNLLKAKLPFADESKSFYDGDHWQEGNGWVGPTPKFGQADTLFIMSEIKKQFASKNIIRSVVDRHVGSLLDSEPVWSFVPVRVLGPDDTPTPDEQEQIRKADEIISAWWDNSEVLEEIKKAVTQCLLTTTGSLRAFVPPGKLIESVGENTTILGVPKRAIGENISDLLFIESSSASIIVDKNTMEKGSLLIKEEDGKETVEMSFIDNEQTVVRTWLDNGNPTDVRLDLNGRLIVQEIKRAKFITEQVISGQKSLNMSLTMMDRNSIQGGFLERVILNASPPGEWVDDPNVPGGRRFEPRPLGIGAGKTTFLSSKVVESSDPEENAIVLPADIRWRDPVSPDTFIKTASEHKFGIYEQASQLHVLISGDAQASGVARVQARADFISSVASTKAQVDAAIKWILDIALDHACLFAGIKRDSAFGLVKPSCDINPSSGPLTREEIDAVLEMVDRDMMSIETAMQELGIEDVDSEISRIRKEMTSPSITRKIKLLEGLSKAGYTFAEDQMGDLDDEVGVKKRDMSIVLEKQAADSDILKETVRRSKIDTTTDDEELNA